jgi:hypothetical protein
MARAVIGSTGLRMPRAATLKKPNAATPIASRTVLARLSEPLPAMSVQLGQVARRRDDHREHRDQGRLRRVQPHLVAQQRLAEHAELGQQHPHGNDVRTAGEHAGCRHGAHQPPPR